MMWSVGGSSVECRCEEEEEEEEKEEEEEEGEKEEEEEGGLPYEARLCPLLFELWEPLGTQTTQVGTNLFLKPINLSFLISCFRFAS